MLPAGSSDHLVDRRLMLLEGGDVRFTLGPCELPVSSVIRGVGDRVRRRHLMRHVDVALNLVVRDRRCGLVAWLNVGWVGPGTFTDSDDRCLQPRWVFPHETCCGWANPERSDYIT